MLNKVTIRKCYIILLLISLVIISVLVATIITSKYECYNVTITKITPDKIYFDNGDSFTIFSIKDIKPGDKVGLLVKRSPIIPRLVIITPPQIIDRCR